MSGPRVLGHAIGASSRTGLPPWRGYQRGNLAELNAAIMAARTGQPPRGYGHGSLAGYQTHRRRGEPPCDACLEARRQYRRSQRESGAA